MFDATSDNAVRQALLDDPLRRTISVYKKGFSVFTFAAGIVLVADALFWKHLLPYFESVLNIDINNFQDEKYFKDHVKEFCIVHGTRWVLNHMISVVASGTMIKAVTEIYLESEPEFVKCLKYGFKKTGTLCFTGILQTVAFGFGLAFFVLPGIYFLLVFSLAEPVVVIENLGAVGSMKRSFSLASRNWCYILCMSQSIGILYLIVQGFWNVLVVGDVTSFEDIEDEGTKSPLSSIPKLVSIPFVIIMKTVIYLKFRTELEGMNGEVLRRNLGGRVYEPLSVGDDEVTENAV